jgi:hypothetical protein
MEGSGQSGQAAAARLALGLILNNSYGGGISRSLSLLKYFPFTHFAQITI